MMDKAKKKPRQHIDHFLESPTGNDIMDNHHKNLRKECFARKR
jgi:hypothetical protein